MRYIAVVSALIGTLGLSAIVATAQGGPTLTQRIDDVAITAEMKARLVAERPANLTSVDVDTRQGVVRLHGSVPTSEDKAVAERIARAANGVKAVYNELTVRNQGTAASPAASPGSGFSGRHTMTGEVTDIDASRGRVELRTGEGDLDLHFPPGALRNVKRGDRVSVELGIRPAP